MAVTPESVQIDQAQTPGAKIATLGITRSGQTVEVQEVAVSNPETGDYLKPDASGALPVAGPLTNAQLRASAVPVSGALTDTELRATPVAVSGPLTDSQLRSAAVPVAQTAGLVSGSLAQINDTVELTVTGFASVSFTVSGNLSGTMTPEYTLDGSTWSTLNVSLANSTAAAYATALSNGSNYVASVVAFLKVRVRATSFASGTSAISIRASHAPLTSYTLLPPSTTLIGDVSLGVRTTTTNAGSRTKILSAASTNATNVKSSAGRVYGWQFANTSASWRFVKLFNKSSSPILGTDIPVDVIAIPPGGGTQFADLIGVSYSLGISYAIVAGAADTDATAVSANDVIGSLRYA